MTWSVQPSLWQGNNPLEPSSKFPEKTPELVERHGAQVESIVELETVELPSLPCYQQAKGGGAGDTIRRAEVVLSFPLENVGINLPALITTVSGNLYELAQFSGLRLLDVEIPAAYADHYPVAATSASTALVNWQASRIAQ